MPPQINLNELYGMLKKKEKNRNSCFDHIIELCHRRIRMIASYAGQNTFYEIPGIVIGYPLYNLNECIDYVVSSLRRNGFLVQILPAPHIGVVYISWNPVEITQSSTTGNQHVRVNELEVQGHKLLGVGNYTNLPALPPSTTSLLNKEQVRGFGSSHTQSQSQGNVQTKITGNAVSKSKPQGQKHVPLRHRLF